MVESYSSEKNLLLLAEILDVYLKEILNINKTYTKINYHKTEESAADFIRTNKKQLLDLALATKQGFDRFDLRGRQADKLSEEIKKLIDQWIKSLESEHLDEFFRITSKINSEVSRLYQLVNYGTYWSIIFLMGEKSKIFYNSCFISNTFYTRLHNS